MTKPDDYKEETIDTLTASSANVGETTVASDDQPNIVVVLLESFCDPTEVNFLQLSEIRSRISGICMRTILPVI